MSALPQYDGKLIDGLIESVDKVCKFPAAASTRDDNNSVSEAPRGTASKGGRFDCTSSLTETSCGVQDHGNTREVENRGCPKGPSTAEGTMLATKSAHQQDSAERGGGQFIAVIAASAHEPCADAVIAEAKAVSTQSDPLEFDPAEICRELQNATECPRCHFLWFPEEADEHAQMCDGRIA